MKELRLIMDEFIQVESAIDELKLLLMICETYCEDRMTEETIAIVGTARRELKLISDDVKKNITKLDKYILMKKNKSQI